ncbi:probable transcription factor At3g04930 [Malania oleifera]|uniref:probable transcription factor At3g04930 n=1 Tax=Malania oleifera TaxID=397392 RepID=UPI0025AE7E58|nr:probable transcription factor At3g04930 [Malania oleifera]XP_057961672.1 probable transcription factor At3g04930 [Malania oleifera]
MAAEENHTAAAIFNEEDLDDDDEEDEEEEDEDEEILTLTPNKPLQSLQNDVVFDEDEEEEEEEDVNTPSSSSNLAGEPLPTSARQVTIAVPGDPTLAAAVPDPKRQRVEEPSRSAPEEKKPSALDESRRLFQRLWTDEDEIELLQGFLEYTAQRGTAQHHHHDTALFYDQIKGKLQLDFNKNQLVEKLRRLKKKYRNVTNRITSGKEFSFKSLHDQATFEISRKIWSNTGRVATVAEDTTFEEEDANPSPNPNPNPNPGSNYHNNTGVDGNVNSAEKKASRSRKRSQVKTPEKHNVLNNTQLGSQSSIPSLVEETVRSCLSPLFKELLHSATNGPCGVRGFGGMASFNPMPLSFGGPSMCNFSGGDVVDEKWRKQQILELEVYAKRLELVQDQIKSALEELRSMGSG